MNNIDNLKLREAQIELLQTDHDCHASPEDGCEFCHNIVEEAKLLCNTCYKWYSDKSNKLSIAYTGDCLNCDHCRGEVI